MIIPINLSAGTIETAAESTPREDVIVGIDLGTTNSLVAYIKNGTPVCVTDAETLAEGNVGVKSRNTLVPSVVHFALDGAVIVGDAAKTYLTDAPERTIYSVKRLMGRSYSDVESEKGRLGYEIIDTNDSTTETLVKVRVGERFYTPIELSARILEALKRRVEHELGASVTKAVITVPAYFNDAQRQATRDAGRLAGLEVLRIINEPTAASLAYGIGIDPDVAQTVAVYDLGGGTFDISILRIEGGVFEVLATNGDTHLGGDDFDQRILDHWATHATTEQRDYLTALSTNPHAKGEAQTLRLLAERAKKELTNGTNFAATFAGFTLTLTREEFEQAIAPLVAQTLEACRAALRDAQLQKTDIDKVLLVGGSTRTPYVKAQVSGLFGREADDHLNPDEVVALGAAVQADILAGNNRDLLLLDITPLSLGIETVGGLMDVIIPRNTKIPARAARQYTTSVDGQVNLKVSVYQGERDLVTHNRKLGEFVMRGIPPMPAALPKLEIGFILDADGILRVRARELRSGVEQTVEMRSQYGLSEEEMAMMLLESIQNAQADMGSRALIEARNEANNIILAADRFLTQHTELLSEEERVTTQYFIDHLRTATTTDDAAQKDSILKAIADLNEYTAPLAHRAMDATIASAMQGKRIA